MKVNKTALKAACACAVSISALSVSSNVSASNWLMLQGTEPASASERATVWGFIQPEYGYTDGTKLPAGPWAGQDAQFNVLPPDLNTNSSFYIRRTQVGVRGQGMPLDSKTNYFFLAEYGNNGISHADGSSSVRLTDASVTLNHIPFARIRFGQFKHPGSEEGLQAIHTFDYNNFTNVTDQMVLERFFDYDGSGTNGGTQNSGEANELNGPVGAFRDIGIQVFDSFKTSAWEHGYAVMVGNGNGITRGDNNENKDVYLYWSSEWVFGGEGPRRQGWKLFAWHQDGKRTIVNEKDTGATTDDVPTDYDRTRYGVGTTYRQKKIRAAAEYIVADGMIFNGTDGGAVAGALTAAGAVASFNILPEEKADGYYLDFGYKVIPSLELDVRYDVLNRATEVAANERKFETWTLGAQYFFNAKTRMTANYEIRSIEAPGVSETTVPGRTAHQIIDSIDDRFTLQVLAIF
jgi:hypothetical protein